MNEQVNEQALKSHTDRRQLHQIIAGLTEGVILIGSTSGSSGRTKPPSRCTA